MAAPGNDRGIYDDAIIVIDRSKRLVRTFNANTDPSAFRKGIATLKPGVHRYKKAITGFLVQVEAIQLFDRLREMKSFRLLVMELASHGQV